jgi:TM2 domain-containing membrane protein YozV
MVFLLAVAMTLMAGGAVAEGALDAWFESSDWREWGWSVGGGWNDGDGRFGEFGRVQEFGNDRRDAPELGPVEDDDGQSLLSGRRLKAGGLSLLVPGAGQLYNGERTKGLIMIGIEAAVWGTYLGFHQHANTLADDYEAWAAIYAGVEEGRSDDLYQAIGRYDDSDAWYDSRLREARAFGESMPDPPGADEQWQWRSEQFRRDYQLLRADANEAYERRDMMVLFAIVNRAISVFDAVRSGGTPQDGRSAGTLDTDVLGSRLALEVSAPLAEPSATVSAAWSF